MTLYTASHQHNVSDSGAGMAAQLAWMNGWYYKHGVRAVNTTLTIMYSQSYVHDAQPWQGGCWERGWRSSRRCG